MINLIYIYPNTSYGGLFSEAKKLYARNQHKDAVTASGIFDRRAAKFQVDNYSSFLVNLAGSPPPAFAMSYAKYRALNDFASEKRSPWDIESIFEAKY
jgi:hypothetical protein